MIRHGIHARCLNARLQLLPAAEDAEDSTKEKGSSKQIQDQGTDRFDLQDRRNALG